MNWLQRFLGVHWYAALRRKVMCRVGYHGDKVGIDGRPANVCCWGCGHVFNKAMWKKYVVTMKDGEELPVEAINEFHARSRVVYGNQRPIVNGVTGKVMNELVNHPDNIKSVRLVDEITEG